MKRSIIFLILAIVSAFATGCLIGSRTGKDAQSQSATQTNPAWKCKLRIDLDGAIETYAADTKTGAHIAGLYYLSREGKLGRFYGVDKTLLNSGYGLQGLEFDAMGRVPLGTDQ